MKNRRKGFTLIELLAVIVIIALVMAIAIPSVTKYITQSRKKTLESSIHEFTASVTIDVNDSKYDIDKDNTIYAIPIECIELEKGGEDPFGKWMPANNKQWAYVLVQYDADKREYTYGFTFKDSGGFGLYPTEVTKIKGGGQIKKDLNLNKPQDGSYKLITDKTNWEGFNIEFDTRVKVLWATEDGDGKHSCTIRHDVDMSEVPEYVPVDDDEEDDDSTIINDGSKAYAIYSADDQSLTFVRLDDSVQVKAGDIFLNKTVTAIYAGIETSYSVPWSAYRENIKKVEFIDKIRPVYTASWFYNFKNLDVIIGMNNLDTSRVTNMSQMFYYAGYNSTTFTLDLGENFDTSKVTNMNDMFCSTGYSSTRFTLDLGDKFDTSNVTNMYMTFALTGYSSPIFKLDLGDKFDTSKVTNMYMLFSRTGYSSEEFTLDLGDKFDTSNVTVMQSMFSSTGYLSKVLTLDLGNKFDTSKVTNMSSLFQGTGYSSTKFTLDLGDKFDTSNVTNMNQMFWKAGYSSEVFTLDLGDKFDTSNVTNMSNMFNSVAYNSKKFTLDLGDKFDTSNVTNMNAMFSAAGYSSPIFKLDCSNWNVDKVTDHVSFNWGGENKITPPVWK